MATTYSISGLEKAEGLTEQERATVSRLVKVYNDNATRNKLRQDYYDDLHVAPSLGYSLPPALADQPVPTGWASKAVNMLADRSILSDIVMSDGECPVDVDAMCGKYATARRSQLALGCGFWTVAPTEAGGIDIRFNDLLSSSAIWDWENGRVKACLAVADWNESRGRYTPNVVNVLMDGANVCIRKDGKGWRVTERNESPMGRAQAVAMPFQPTSQRPFGRSRITRPVMQIIDWYQDEVRNTMLHSALFSSPRRYILGVDPGAKKVKSDLELYMDRVLMISRDRNGDVPQVGQFAQESMAPHIELMEYLAGRMAEQTDLPLSAFSVQSNGYTSSEALAASSGDLILAAENMNDTNGRAIAQVINMALAVKNGASYDEVVRSGVTAFPRFVDPSMPTMAAKSDSMIKKVASIPWLAETSVALEDLGYDRATQRILEGERDAAEMRRSVNAMFFTGDAAE